MIWSPPPSCPPLPPAAALLPRRGSLRSRFSRLGCLGAVLLGGIVAHGALPAAVHAADDAAVLDSVTKLNKRALEEYDNLSFDVARRTLDEALEMCTKNDLDNHPIKARTHLHMGVVLLAMEGAQRDEAIQQFQKALTIQPDIKPSERLANPEVQSAFNEAKNNNKTSGAAAVVPPTATVRRTEKPAAAGPPTPPPPPTPGLEHEAVRSAARETVIPITVTTAPSLAAKKVALWFRAGGAPKFVSVDLREYTPGNWSGEIPETATANDEVAYFISVENDQGEVVASQGSASDPMAIDLRGVPAPVAAKPASDESPDDPEPTPPREEPTWFLGLAVGSGIGWASGNGDVNDRDKVVSAFGLSQLGHLLPEFGYFVDPNVILSLQLRAQSVSGATSVRDPSGTMCGATHVCEPATGAWAGLARVTWLMGEGLLVPYVSGAIGVGHIRHLAKFPNATYCGADPAKPELCVDTVTAGPVLLGPGAGFILHATPNFGFTLGLATLLGFPAFTFHVDVNAGVVVEL